MKKLFAALFLVFTMAVNVSADGNNSTRLNFGTYAPILGLAVLGFISTRFIKRTVPEQNTE